MRIGVEATCFSNKRGYGRFTRSLLRALLALDRRNSYVFFIDSSKQLFDLPNGAEVIRIPTKFPALQAASANSHRSLRDVWLVSRTIARQRLDVLFFPSVYTFVPVFSRVPKLVAVHDTIPELFPALVFPTRISHFFWKRKMQLCRWQANMILTVSDYSRRCLVQHLGISPSRIRVVPEASDSSFRPLAEPASNGFLNRYGMTSEDAFLLYVGGFSPHKNLFQLLDVFGQLRMQAGLENLRLVLAGDFSEDAFYSCYQELRQKAAQANLDKHIVFTGFASDVTLLHLFNLARVVVLPSHAEGFGLPAIEAAACGTPVVATTCSPLPELLGKGGLYVSPTDPQGLLVALKRVLTEDALRREMGAAGLRAVSVLTWENSARRLLATLEEVARNQRDHAI